MTGFPTINRSGPSPERLRRSCSDRRLKGYVGRIAEAKRGARLRRVCLNRIGAANLGEVGGERIAGRGGKAELGLVIGMIDPEPNRRALLGGGRHFGRQFEAQKVHGGRLDFGLALQVLVGDRPDALVIGDFEPTPPSRTRSAAPAAACAPRGRRTRASTSPSNSNRRESEDYRRRAPPGSAPARTCARAGSSLAPGKASSARPQSATKHWGRAGLCAASCAQ